MDRVNIENIALFDSILNILLGIMLLFDILNNEVIRIEVTTRLYVLNGLTLSGTHHSISTSRHWT